MAHFDELNQLLLTMKEECFDTSNAAGSCSFNLALRFAFYYVTGAIFGITASQWSVPSKQCIGFVRLNRLSP